MGFRRKFNFLPGSAIKNRFRCECCWGDGKYFTMHKFNVDITQEIKSEFLFFSVEKRACRKIWHNTAKFLTWSGNLIEFFPSQCFLFNVREIQKSTSLSSSLNYFMFVLLLHPVLSLFSVLKRSTSWKTYI